MTDITIPPEALRAARTAYLKATHLSWQGAVDAACHAMLKAWPRGETVCGELGLLQPVIYLPLTENTDDHH